LVVEGRIFWVEGAGSVVGSEVDVVVIFTVVEDGMVTVGLLVVWTSLSLVLGFLVEGSMMKMLCRIFRFLSKMLSVVDFWILWGFLVVDFWVVGMGIWTVVLGFWVEVLVTIFMVLVTGLGAGLGVVLWTSILAVLGFLEEG
jgi:hypothetical protein